LADPPRRLLRHQTGLVSERMRLSGVE
jgi:hypothetical protein